MVMQIHSKAGDMSTILTPDDLVLAIDTATPVQSLAIVKGKAVLFEASIQSVTKEGPGLLSLVDAALKQCELRIEDIARFVVSRGPGAFTGLRVSMAMLKSMALTLEKPLYAASSLEAIAREALPSHEIVASCIDARRGELYVSFWGPKDGTVQAISDELLMKPADFAAYVAQMFPGQKLNCVGTAFPNYTAKLMDLCDNIICRPQNPRAAALARIILDRYPAEMPDIALESLEPRYIRMDDFVLPKPFDFNQPTQFRADHK